MCGVTPNALLSGARDAARIRTPLQANHSRLFASARTRVRLQWLSEMHQKVAIRKTFVPRTEYLVKLAITDFQQNEQPFLAWGVPFHTTASTPTCAIYSSNARRPVELLHYIDLSATHRAKHLAKGVLIFVICRVDNPCKD